MKQAKHSAGFRLHLMYTPTHAKPAPGHSRAMRAASLFLAAACLLLSVSVYPATAATSMSSLQNKLDKLSQSIVQHKKELSNAKKKEQAAKALESELKEKVTVVQSQISVLKGQIAEVQNSIGLKEQEIAAKEQQITEKEAEIADQWGDFKQHMAAMQELRDGGSVAMLSAVNDLYELLTFNEVMQDISIKDTEILDNMKNAKEALESDKLTLESQRSELQSKKADLDAQNSQMRAKQNELNSSVAAAQMSAAEAQQAQKDAQAAIESDEMNYEAVKKQIQKMIAAAAASKPTLSFTGFICPLKSYSRISSEYGWRKNPVTGVNKLHAGTDFAAPGGTPIYAAASGYVQVAGWSSGGYGNYVIIYHGKMTDGNAYSTLYGHMRSVATSAGKHGLQITDRRHRLDQQTVNAGIEQGVRLFARNASDFTILGRVLGKPLNTDRAHRAQQHLRVRLAGIVDGPAIDLRHGRRNLVVLEGIARCPKGVGNEHLRAGGDIQAMDTRNGLRLRQIPKRRWNVGGIVLTQQNTAHGALRQQGLARQAARKFLGTKAVVITRIHIYPAIPRR